MIKKLTELKALTYIARVGKTTISQLRAKAGLDSNQAREVIINLKTKGHITLIPKNYIIKIKGGDE